MSWVGRPEGSLPGTQPVRCLRGQALAQGLVRDRRASRLPFSQHTPFIGVKPAPHALLLTAAERPSQARVQHSTAPTNVLGPLELRPRERAGADGKEQFRVDVAARRAMTEIGHVW